jgi:MFS family permease
MKTLIPSTGETTTGPTRPDHYKWTALANTTLGVLMATINTSIILISLPQIFDGIHLNPLLPSSTGYLLWMLMGFLVVTAVLVVTLGRIGDMYGRVRIYNLGFAIFTVFSILLAVTWFNGVAAALWLIVLRIGQGVGAACLMANSTAILTDAFPENERGMAIGINSIALVGGSFIGLLLGGLLGPVNWHLIFLVSVPFGVFGTVWGYAKLKDQGLRTPAPIDWWGNITFAIGLIALLAGITYGIMPYGHHVMGWTNPMVLAAVIGGVAMLGVFGYIETRVADPMIDLRLFRIRAFSAGNFAGFLGALGRGGLMFLLILWLQGVWLPLHGYNFEQTPLWAGIYMLPLTIGMLAAAPLAGWLSDRFGARPFATGGMLGTALGFLLLAILPVDFDFVAFAGILLLIGLSQGLFTPPNRAGIMNSLPADRRGAGAGVANTFQNSAQVLSIGIFFTLIIVGLASSLPGRLYHGLVAQGLPASTATSVSHLPPVASLFAAFLGYNPMAKLLGSQLGHVSPGHAAYLTGHSFFPHLISGSFQSGLHEALYFATAMCLLAAGASWMRGSKYVHPAAALDASTLQAPAHHERLVAAEDAMASFETVFPMGITEEDADMGDWPEPTGTESRNGAHATHRTNGSNEPAALSASEGTERR